MKTNIIRILLFLSITLFGYNVLLYQQNTYTLQIKAVGKARFPSGKRWGNVAVAIPNTSKAFIGLGACNYAEFIPKSPCGWDIVVSHDSTLGGSCSAFYDDWWEYDTATNTFTKKANYPGLGRVGCIAVFANNKIYVGLGSGVTGSGTYTLSTDWWEYDIPNDTWTPKTNFPSNGREYAKAFVWQNQKIFVGGGVTLNSNGSFVISKELWEYDILTNSWSQKKNLPTNQGIIPFHILKNKVVYGRGYYEYNVPLDSFVNTNNICQYVYSVDNDACVESYLYYYEDSIVVGIGNLPEPVGCGGSSCCLGGWTYCFNCSLKRDFNLSSFFPLGVGASFNIGNIGYVIGGVRIVEYPCSNPPYPYSMCRTYVATDSIYALYPKMLVTGIEKIENNLSIIIHPNPSQNVVYIKSPLVINWNELKIKCFDIVGKEYFLQSQENKVDVSYLNNGIYFIIFHYGENIYRYKLVKN